MSKPKTVIKISAKTHKGMVRDHNEDDHIFCQDLTVNQWGFFENTDTFEVGKMGTLLVVADGMGGMNAGEVASRLAKEGIQEFFSSSLKEEILQDENRIKSFMKNAILTANDKIIKRQKEDKETEGMGTTLIMAWIYANRVYISWTGDSRCYRYNPESGLQALSKDHSYVQELIDAGKITEEQAFYHPDSNIVSQSLGDEKHKPKPDFRSYDLNEGDRILLCSDGLNAMLQDLQIREIFENNPELDSCVSTLLEETNKAGGHDNTTIVIAEVEKVGGAINKNKGITKSSKQYLLYLIFALSIAVVIFGYYKFFTNTEVNNQKTVVVQSDFTAFLKQNSEIKDTISIHTGDTLLILLSDTILVKNTDTFIVNRIAIQQKTTPTLAKKTSEEVQQVPSTVAPTENMEETVIDPNDLSAILNNLVKVLKEVNINGENINPVTKQISLVQYKYKQYANKKTEENKKEACTELVTLITNESLMNAKSEKIAKAFVLLNNFRDKFCTNTDIIVNEDSGNNLTVINDSPLVSNNTFVYDKKKDPNNIGLSPIKKNGKWGYVGTDNLIKIKCTYDKAYSFGEKYAFVKVNNQWAVIDKNDLTIIAAQSQWNNPQTSFNNGKAKVISLEGDTICINPTNEIIDCK